MYIDGLHVVSNDGLHGATERCGDLRLAQGKHIAYVDGFQNGGAGDIRATYKGPDTFDKTDWVGSADCAAHPGWQLDVFRGSNLLATPNTRGMPSVGSSVIQTIDINSQSRFNFAVSGTPQ